MNEPRVQEEDRIASRRLGVLAVVAVVLIVLAVGFSTATLWGRPIVGQSIEPKRPDQIGIVEQSAVQTARRADDLKTAQRAQLSHYRWIDDAHEVAEIPIERAMAVVAEQKR